MGDVVQLRDYQSKKDLARMYGETMEQQAIGIVDYINGLTGIPYGGAGIDWMISGNFLVGGPSQSVTLSVSDLPDVTQNVDISVGSGEWGHKVLIDATQATAFHAPEKDPA